VSTSCLKSLKKGIPHSLNGLQKQAKTLPVPYDLK
jgi:hypothetical protein